MNLDLKVIASKVANRTLIKVLVPFMGQTCQVRQKGSAQGEIIDIMQLHCGPKNNQIISEIHDSIVFVQAGHFGGKVSPGRHQIKVRHHLGRYLPLAPFDISGQHTPVSTLHLLESHLRTHCLQLCISLQIGCELPPSEPLVFLERSPLSAWQPFEKPPFEPYIAYSFLIYCTICSLFRLLKFISTQ